MNYALLRKYQYTGDSQELDKVFAQSARALRANKSPGCYEIVLYLADSEPDIFFAMSLWFSLEELASIFKRPPTLAQVGGVVLIEQKIFELVQEYRQLDTKIEASLMRLTKYSEPLDPSRTLKSTTEGKNKARQLSGFVGGWAGRCLSDSRLLLTRADWSSQTAFRAFLEDASPNSLVKWYFSQGIHNENASYDLRAVISLVP
jgi:heme-degrading monooxygenase HmoA